MNEEKEIKKVRFTDKQIKLFMIILFILTIASMHLGILALFIVVDILDVPYILVFNYAWVFFCFLPIPLLSIILGFYFKNRVKCKKNVIGGFIMIFFLFCLGMTSLYSIPDNDYNEFMKYQKYLNVSLPAEGIYIKNIYNYYEIKDSIQHIILFEKGEETNKLVEEITLSEQWILEEDLSTSLSYLIPYGKGCSSSNGCFYSFYIDELEKFNVMPTENGSYHVYAMKYDKYNAELILNEYVLNYKE